MKTKLFLLCAAAICMPAISCAQEGVAIRILESGSEKLAQQGTAAAGMNLLIKAENGLGAAGKAMNAAAGQAGENALGYKPETNAVTETKVRKAVKSQTMAEYVSRHGTHTITGPAFEPAPGAASAKDLQEIEQVIVNNLTMPMSTSMVFVRLFESREIVQILQEKAAEYSAIIKNPASPDKPEFLTFNELASVLILRNPKEFISYVKDQTKNKNAISYSKFVVDMMAKARTSSFNFQYYDEVAGPEYLFHGTFAPENAVKENIMKELYPAWFLAGRFTLSTTIRYACEAAVSGEPPSPSMYLIYEIPVKEQYLDYRVDRLTPHFADGKKFVLDPKTIPGTSVYKFNPFTMTWTLYGRVE